ncbi:GDP-L-fucose synthase [Pseudorhodoplanes sp.]|uniref:GDP-L-fucose synthase n=1 Tax=Pseudorhodoplanes sp. TaxID=1934341 RepID=UPI003D117058
MDEAVKDRAVAPIIYPLSGKRIWVSGHRGMVGSAVVRRLASEGCEILTVSRADTDLRRQAEVEAWMAREKPHAVVVAAAKVGGILANDTQPASFLYDNLMIEANIVHAALETGVEKLLFLGSSCIYPKLAPQPMTEDALLTGPLEPTNEWYAIAKIAGIKLCQAYRKQHGKDFISAMPTNLYGPGDNYDLQGSHVLPALLRKAHEAKLAHRDCVDIWGSGMPRREFMHVDDLADALVFLLQRYSGAEHLNVGTGTDLTIRELAELICEVVGFKGDLRFDSSKPDGTPRKLLDVSRLAALGWTAQIGLEAGVRGVYAGFLEREFVSLS